MIKSISRQQPYLVFFYFFSLGCCHGWILLKEWNDLITASIDSLGSLGRSFICYCGAQRTCPKNITKKLLVIEKMLKKMLTAWSLLAVFYCGPCGWSFSYDIFSIFISCVSFVGQLFKPQCLLVLYFIRWGLKVTNKI